MDLGPGQEEMQAPHTALALPPKRRNLKRTEETTQRGSGAQWVLSPPARPQLLACLHLCPEQQRDGEKGPPSLQRRPLEQNSAWEQSILTSRAAARINYLFHQRPQTQELDSNLYLFKVPNDS